MSDDKFRAALAMSSEELCRSFDREIIASLDTQPEAPPTTDVFPLNGDERAYRGWYHVSGTAQSRWCPKQSLFGGPRPDGPHKGADLWSYRSTRIVAVTSGSIQYNPINDPQGWGNHIYLYFKRNNITYIAVYAHLDARSAFQGVKAVNAGAEIGYPGCSGNAGVAGACHRTYKCGGKIAIEDHLHLELMVAATTVREDPVAFFGFANVKHASDQTCTVCGSTEQLV